MRERCVQVGGTSRDRSVGARGVETARRVGGTCDLRVTGVVSIGDASGIGGEDGSVVDFAGDPSLHERDVLMGWNLNWLSTGVQPCKGVIAGQS